MGRHDGPIVEATRIAVPARKRQQRIAIFLAVGVIGAAAAMVAFLAPREEELTLSSWDEAVVALRDLPQTVDASGSVVTENERQVAATEEGSVARVAVGEGRRVARGELLLVVASPELEDELEDQRARLAGVEREIEQETVDADYAGRKAALRTQGLARSLEDAEAAEKRSEQLKDVRAATASSYEQARRTTENARRTLEEARMDAEGAAELARIRLRSLQAERVEAAAKVARLEERVASLQIRSPMDGTVVKASAEEGDPVAPNAPLLVVADTDHPSVELRVAESEVAPVEVGQEVTITVASRALAGRVSSVGLRAEGGSASQAPTVAVRVRFDAPPGDLIAGSSVTGEIRTGTKEGALVLPRGPWLGTGESRFVYRVAENDRAVRVPVSIGAVRGMEIEVLTGVEAGDRIIVSGYQEYRDRESVRLARKGERK